MPDETLITKHFYMCLMLGLLFVITLVFLLTIIFKRSSRHHIEKEQMEHRHQHRQAREAERVMVQVSREVHDTIGQNASLMRILLAEAFKLGTDGKQLELLSDITGIALQVISDATDISHTLNQDFIIEQGLENMIDATVKHLNNSRQLRSEMGVAGNLRKLPPQIKLVAYRIAQQAINNIVRHAQAAHVSAELSYIDGRFVMCIADDGKGFDPQALTRQAADDTSGPVHGIGISNMKARAKLLGGILNIVSSPGQGTVVQLLIESTGTTFFRALKNQFMHIEFPDNKGLSFTEGASPEYRRLSIPYAQTAQVTGPFGSIIAQQYVGIDFSLSRHFIYIEQPVELKVNFKEPVLILSYLLDGEIAYLEAHGADSSMTRGRYHLSYENKSVHPVFLGKGYLEYLQITFADRYLQDLARVSGPVSPLLTAFLNKSTEPLHTPFFSITARIRKIIRDITGYNGGHTDLFIQSRINDLLLQFLVSVATQDTPQASFTSDQRRFEKITDFIEQNLHKHLTVELLAAQYGYEKTALHRKFKDAYKTSLYQYIQERRMQQARRLLMGQPNYTITRIAEMCGYTDNSNFLNAFKKRFGHSTSHYRRIKDQIS